MGSTQPSQWLQMKVRCGLRCGLRWNGNLPKSFQTKTCWKPFAKMATILVCATHWANLCWIPLSRQTKLSDMQIIKKRTQGIHGICKYKCKECNANKWCQFHSGPQGGSIRTNECIVCVYKQAKLSREWRAFKDLWIEAGKQTAKGNTFLERRLKWQMTNYCYETEGDGT